MTRYQWMRGLRWSVIVLLCAAALAMLWLQLRGTSLSGIRVAGSALPPTADVNAALKARADEYLSETITLTAGAYRARATRRRLGAQRPVDEIGKRITSLGRSGNPLTDLPDVLRSLRSGWDLAWPITVQRAQLADVVREISRHIDQPPMAGTIGEGWSMPGVPGVTLNSLDALSLIEAALRNGATSVSLMVRQVPPPNPIELGAPDGALEDEHDTALDDPQLAAAAATDPAALRAFQPAEWAPSRGPECDLGGAYSRFCQGPRRVALAHGAAAELAERLGLGTFKAVSHLILQAPRPEWVAAVGDASSDATLLYPVKGGTLWRGFGFVRRGDLKDMLHKGVDIGAPVGTPLRAVNDAIVAYADNGVRGYGNLLVLIHGSGSVTSYAHCTAIYVFPGQTVRRGQIVGEVGDTGIARGAHLHFEYRRGGHPVDPQERFVKD